ncbi:DUF2489 domain-containing protein [Vibrio salilacus]|uniref:DUF2489 domain-containing protein n=1 Tax=Vibrio salilacus TaxID=1323749 RepID=UPI000C29654B|nr:DUF2489 domain-containing protein [Vibrio salilacus]
MNVTLLAIAGGAIILGLTVYAGYLLLQLKKQKDLQLQHHQLAIEKRNANIFESVSVLCLAGIQEQCDLSEISIRVYNIMDYVQGEDRVDFDQEFPATSELFHIVKDMPRGEERQQLDKQQRMKHNLERHKAEARLQQDIIEELKRLQKKIQPLNNQINIQMI